MAHTFTNRRKKRLWFVIKCHAIIGKLDDARYNCTTITRHQKTYLVTVCHYTPKKLYLYNFIQCTRVDVSLPKQLIRRSYLKSWQKSLKRKIKIDAWRAEVVERKQDEFYWSRCSIWNILQCNGSVKDWLSIKQSNNYHPLVYFEECICTGAESKQCNKLIDSDDDAIFVCKRRQE